MKIALVDDEEESAEKIERLLTDTLGGSAEIRRFNSGEEFCKSFAAGDFDVVFLDIYMPGITGVQTAKFIRGTDKHVKLVFCSTSNEFASESYAVNACYYLKKPFDSSEFSTMLDRFEVEKTGNDRILLLPGGRAVKLKSIIYADYSAHYMNFHTSDGENTSVRMSFAEAEEKLCKYPYFCSVSKGVIINFYEIESRTRDVFIMKDGSGVPISRRRYKDVMHAYARFNFDILRRED